MVKLYRGDNLAVIRRLQNDGKKFNLVYLDPPYNSKNSGLSYSDSFNSLVWKRFFEKRVTEVSKVIEKNAVIFTSIGNEELSNCLLVLDKIFGKSTRKLVMPRLASFSRKTTGTISRMHDFLIINVIGKVEFKGTPLLNNKSYRLKDKYFNERGAYQLRPLDSKEFKYSKSLDFPITHFGKKYFPGGKTISNRYFGKNDLKKQTYDWCWRWSKQLVEFAVENDFIVSSNSRLFKKTYENCKIVKEKKKYSVSNIVGEKKFTSVELCSQKYLGFKENKVIQSFFKYSKPLSFVEFIVSLPKFDVLKVLDPFAGSGVTGLVCSRIKEAECSLIQAEHLLKNKSDLYDTNGILTIYDLTKKILEINKVFFEEITFVKKTINAKNQMIFFSEPKATWMQ